MSQPLIINCKHLDTCDRIKAIEDKDWVDSQKISEICKLCQHCKVREREEV